MFLEKSLFVNLKFKEADHLQIFFPIFHSRVYIEWVLSLVKKRISFLQLEQY